MAPISSYVSAAALHLLPRDDHDDQKPADSDHGGGGLSGWAIFVIVAVVVIIIALIGLFVWKVILKRPVPSAPALGGSAGGAKNWLSNVAYKLKNPRARSTTAGFEPSGISAGRARGGTGRGALDPDEAWDARVGNEADYNPFFEETELREQGAGAGSNSYYDASYGDTGYRSQTTGTLTVGGEERGRSKSPAAMPRENPFGDDAAASLRSISPRPVIDIAAAKKKGTDSTQSSPRRSVFRESL